jgi:hypothetical protein
MQIQRVQCRLFEVVVVVAQNSHLQWGVSLCSRRKYTLPYASWLDVKMSSETQREIDPASNEAAGEVTVRYD